MLYLLHKIGILMKFSEWITNLIGVFLLRIFHIEN